MTFNLYLVLYMDQKQPLFPFNKNIYIYREEKNKAPYKSNFFFSVFGPRFWSKFLVHAYTDQCYFLHEGIDFMVCFMVGPFFEGWTILGGHVPFSVPVFGPRFWSHRFGNEPPAFKVDPLKPGYLGKRSRDPPPTK